MAQLSHFKVERFSSINILRVMLSMRFLCLMTALCFIFIYYFSFRSFRTSCHENKFNLRTTHFTHYILNVNVNLFYKLTGNCNSISQNFLFSLSRAYQQQCLLRSRLHKKILTYYL